MPIKQKYTAIGNTKYAQTTAGIACINGIAAVAGAASNNNFQFAKVKDRMIKPAMNREKPNASVCGLPPQLNELTIMLLIAK